MNKQLINYSHCQFKLFICWARQWILKYDEIPNSGYLNCLQTTWASVWPQFRSQILPQTPLLHTSTLPSCSITPTSLTVPSPLQLPGSVINSVKRLIQKLSFFYCSIWFQWGCMMVSSQLYSLYRRPELGENRCMWCQIWGGPISKMITMRCSYSVPSFTPLS